MAAFDGVIFQCKIRSVLEMGDVVIAVDAIVVERMVEGLKSRWVLVQLLN